MSESFSLFPDVPHSRSEFLSYLLYPVVLVNMNRLYLKQVRIIQKKYTSDKEREEAEKVLHVINTTLRKIPDERQMFVDMSVKDVKFCFHNELVNLPANSFRKINMCKMQEANG